MVENGNPSHRGTIGRASCEDINIARHRRRRRDTPRERRGSEFMIACSLGSAALALCLAVAGFPHGNQQVTAVIRL
jgi:hypothetical protein